MSHTNHQDIPSSKYTQRYTPRHPIAADMIKQIDAQSLRAQDIARAMGYLPKDVMAACDRLRYVLSSDVLGLNDTDGDDYFTAHGFLQALLSVLDMDDKSYADTIAQIEYDLAHYPYPLPKYHLRADIDFNFTTGANWMSRGAASSKANVSLPKDMATMTDLARKSVIEQYIAAHYAKYQSNLPYNGIITGYRLLIKQGDDVIDNIEYELPV